MSDNRPRLLHRHSELGYTSAGAEALPGAGEALSDEQLERLTDAARRRERDRRGDALRAMRERLRHELDYHAAQARHRERELRRLERELRGR